MPRDQRDDRPTMDAADRVSRLTRMLVGWANYFCLGPVSKAYRIVDRHARHRLRQWLCAKHKVQGQGTSQYPDEYCEQTLGLVRLQSRTHNFPWATT
jgi:RNA-directed DNA polymerase